MKYTGVIALGLKRGHPVKKRLRTKKTHKSVRKARIQTDVITEVCGYAPYERRVMELLRNGLDKRALKLAKKRLGSHAAGKNKREQLSSAIRKAKVAH